MFGSKRNGRLLGRSKFDHSRLPGSRGALGTEEEDSLLSDGYASKVFDAQPPMSFGSTPEKAPLI
jgi:hypothetical protein